VVFFRAKFVNKVRPLPIRNKATTSLVLTISVERLEITPNERRANPEMKRQI